MNHAKQVPKHWKFFYDKDIMNKTKLKFAEHINEIERAKGAKRVTFFKSTKCETRYLGNFTTTINGELQN